MIFSYLKKKFGRVDDIPPAMKFYSPLRIGLHSTITIDVVDWLIMKDYMNKVMVLPFGKLSVLAIGTIHVDDDIIYNIYTQDSNKEEFTIQIFCVKTSNGSEQVNELTMFKQIVSIVPLTENEWDDNMDGIGQTTMTLDKNVYSRIWGKDNDCSMHLLKFYETIVDCNKSWSISKLIIYYKFWFLFA